MALATPFGQSYTRSTFAQSNHSKPLYGQHHNNPLVNAVYMYTKLRIYVRIYITIHCNATIEVVHPFEQKWFV